MKRIFMGAILCAMLLTPFNAKADTSVNYIHNGELINYIKSSKMNVTGYFAGDNIKHISQRNTGTYSLVNCGPTCIAMIGSYFNKDIDVQRLNEYILPTSKGYSVQSLEKMLKKYKIPYTWGVCNIEGKNEIPDACLVKYIESNHIILLAIDTQYLRTQAELPENKTFSSQIGRTYTGTSGHFILCTGYLTINNTLYYQILDPLEESYTYIPASDISKAMMGNWTSCFLFNKFVN